MEAEKKIPNARPWRRSRPSTFRVYADYLTALVGRREAWRFWRACLQFLYVTFAFEEEEMTRMDKGGRSRMSRKGPLA